MRRNAIAIATAVLAVVLCLGSCRESMYPAVDQTEANPTPKYAALLREVVTYDGYVDYDKLEASRGPLDEYVAWIAYSRAWRLERPIDRPADYINAYNALVLYQVLERGRPKSVMDVQGWLPVPGAKFFAMTQFKLGREWVSLSEIEHERVRNTLLDYRVHAALNCASRSCPPFRRDLYSDKSLGMQLRSQMQRWIADDRALYLEGDTVVFSPIFDWYARDFEFWSAGLNICEIARKHALGPRQQELTVAARDGCKHRFFEYDWSLNDATFDER